MLHRTNSAAELDRILGRSQDRLDRLAIAAFARKSAIEINNVQPLESLVLEGFRLRTRVFVVDGRTGHFAEFQSDALALLEVDGGKKDHRIKRLPRLQNALSSTSSGSRARPDIRGNGSSPARSGSSRTRSR